MARSSTSYVKGNPGRPVGTVVEKVQRTKNILFKLTSDPKFEQVLRKIMLNPEHAEWRFVVELAFNNTLGKPTEHVHQTSDGTITSTTYIERLTIAREMLEYRANADSNAIIVRPELPTGHSD